MSNIKFFTIAMFAIVVFFSLSYEREIKSDRVAVVLESVVDADTFRFRGVSASVRTLPLDCSEMNTEEGRSQALIIARYLRACDKIEIERDATQASCDVYGRLLVYVVCDGVYIDTRQHAAGCSLSPYTVRSKNPPERASLY